MFCFAEHLFRPFFFLFSSAKLLKSFHQNILIKKSLLLYKSTNLKLGCLKLTYQKNNLEVNKNYFKKELTSKNSSKNDYNYLLFGSQMPGRSFTSENYRFGFNGKEKDDEMKGEGNSLDFGARMHDPRLGRFLSIDPKWSNFPSMSPYTYAGNSPILFIDKNGEHPVIAWLIRNFSIGVVTDVMLQASINWLLSEDGDVGQAFKDVDYIDATWNGATNTLKLGKKSKIALNGGYAVAKGYWDEGSNYTGSDAIIDFLVGGGAAVIGDKLTSFIGNKGSTYVYSLFKGKGLKAGQIRSILQASGFGKNVWNWENSGLISVGAAREMRGNLIEDWLGSSIYRKLQQTPYANKLLDFVGDNMNVSVKSVKNMTSSFKSNMKKHIDNLSNAGFNGETMLDIRYNSGGGNQGIIDDLVKYGKEKGVNVSAKVFK